ncbi:MAG: SurA N-terminal domain-containing protein [Desulfobulbaceae bacterium]|nr:SurA N-terminal domain-containing protein [Desulfobulbaceae bacterium]
MTLAVNGVLPADKKLLLRIIQMKLIRTTCTGILTALFCSLVIATVTPVHAFKGIGSSGGAMMNQDDGTPQNITIEGHGENADVVVATVNGVKITMGTLMNSMMENIVQKGYSMDNLSSELTRRIRSESLEQLALEELAYQRAISLGISADPAVVQAQLDAQIQSKGSREALDADLSKKNKSFDDLKNEITRYMIIKQLIRQEVNDNVTVSPEEIDTVYQNNRDEFVTKERVVVTDITFFLDPADPASRERVLAVKKEILQEHGGDPTALTPQGFVVRNQINVSTENQNPLYDAAKKLEVGSFSDPLVIDGTLHLIKFDFHEPRTEKPVKEAKAYVAQKIKAAKHRELLANWRKSLIDEADIKIVHEMLQDKHED